MTVNALLILLLSLWHNAHESNGVLCIVRFHHTYIADVERGNRSLAVNNIEAIAKGLNVTLSDLVNRIETAFCAKARFQAISQNL